MSYQAVNAVLKFSKSKNGARLVILVIAAHANAQGKDAWPNEQTICAEAQLGERAVRYAIRELEKLGELVVNGGHGRGIHRQYEIKLPIAKEGQDLPLLHLVLTPNSDSEKGENSTEKGAESAPKKRAEGNKRGKTRQKKGQNWTGKGAKFDGLYKEEKSMNSPEKSMSSANALDGCISVDRCLELFEEHRKSIGGYEAPYRRRREDFIQLNALLQLCMENNWLLTEDRFLHGLKHYLETPQSSHTLADFTTRFSEFYRTANDRFNKPVEQKGKSNATTHSSDDRKECFERAAKRIRATKVL